MEYIHITPQFKTNTLFQTYRFELPKEKRAEVALLARLFQYGTADFPSKRALKQHLEYLYNVQFTVGVERDGSDLILTFALGFPEYRFVDDEAALKQALTLFQTLLTTPYFMAATHFETEFEQEKQHLIEQIESVYDDKTQYAFTKLQSQLLKNTPYFEDITGSVEMVQALMLEDVRSCWLLIQKSAQVDMYQAVAKEETATAISEQFPKTGQNNTVKMESKEVVFPMFEEVETQDITQAKINFALKSGVFTESDDYFASLVGTSILGGGSQSKLFQNVREKESLAYYANAIADSNSGLVYIYSGVNIQKIDDAKRCIFKQVEAMKKGEISDEELALTKKIMINGLRESLNRPMGIVQFARKLHKHEGIETLEAYIEKIESVTCEDVKAVAQKWEPIASFILKGGQ